MQPPWLGGRTVSGAALLVLLLCAAAAPARAQNSAEAPDPVSRLDPLTGKPGPKQKPPPVGLAVLVGQDNSFRADQPAPVRVVLDNNDKAVSGRLELRDFSGHVSEMPYDLPRSAHKEYAFYARLTPDTSHPQGASGEVVVLEGHRVLARQLLIPRRLDSVPLILSVTDEGKNLQFLNEDRKEQFLNPGKHYQTVVTSPQDLPRQWPGYNPADVVTMSGHAWSRLTEDQKRAFRIWVEQGGRAILWGERPDEWRDAEARSLTGVVPGQLASVTELRGIARWGGSPYRARAGKLLTVTGPLHPGTRVEVAEGDRPLIATRRALLGKVIWIGFDPLRENVRQWDGFAPFWKKLLSEATVGGPAPGLQPLENCEDARTAANSLPRLPAPPMGAIVAFGVMYAFIFGPLNIWMLRRMRRTVRSWLFMPSLAASMTLVVLVIGQTWGSARTVLNSVSVLQTTAGARTAVEASLVGLFSPTNRAFDITVDDPAPGFRDTGGADGVDVGTGITLGWPDHQNEGIVRWDAVALQLYSTRVLAENRPRDLGGSLDVAIAAARLGAPPGGTVRNGTNLSLAHAYLRRRGQYYPLGDLPSGKQVSVNPAGWTRSFPKDLARHVHAAGQLQETRRFRDALTHLWTAAAETLAPEREREDLWLVAECADYPGSLDVAHVPYNNRAGLLMVRVPQNPEQL